ncbi:beta-N-acetylhexosaminidase [Microterricola viridarii]|uniref:beta-N-acetylhexosaminidase n=1 Tax=Microterricola viridarii TaxID=412690 RepID=UPI0009E924C3|nr:beta-N-acetylhexosaminidase [Microterricola viridarii]
MPALIPAPVTLDTADGQLTLSAATAVSASAELAAVALRLQEALRPATGFALPVREASAEPAAGDIRLSLDENPGENLAAEGYRLHVDATGVEIVGGSPAGVFWGVQALRQLLPASIYRSSLVRGVDWQLPFVTITDNPRFGWRGTMLDVARHFLPKRELLRFIDLMAVHRLNVLHLHLTDDQGWRLQIRAFPRLTEVGGWRSESQRGHGPLAQGNGRPHGGFYTQDDIREIVEYAAERFVTIVPEIETPGHVQAAIAAYPELGVGDPAQAPSEPWTKWGVNTPVLNLEESTLDFLRTVFDEVMELFPSRHIGVGGDEAKKVEWEQDPRSQERIRELGLANEEEAQSWFMRQLDAHLTAAGRTLFGWDEILEGGLTPGATVASWRGSYGAIAAARAGHPVVLCPDDLVYLDYRQSDSPAEPIPIGPPLSLDEVYAFEPVPTELTASEAALVLGGQANIWSEHIDSPRHLDYMAFPRLCALAEAVWGPQSRDLAGFRARLDVHLGRLDALGVEYRAESGPRPWQSRPDAPGKPMSREQRLAVRDELIANLVAADAAKAADAAVPPAEASSPAG